MAVESNAACDGYSGSAAPFVTQVTIRVDGVTVATIDHAATDDGPWWSFSAALDLAGDHVVEVWDRTAGNDYRQEGDNFHASYSVSCPVATTTTELASTTTAADTTTTTELATTTTTLPATTEPVATVALEPSTTETTVTYSAPVPKRETPTTIAGWSDLYSAPSSTVVCQEDEACWDCTTMGNLICGTTTTLAEPAGCCSDYVGDTTATVAVPHGELAVTGGDAAPLVGVGVVFVALGMVALRVRRPRRVRV